MVHGVWPGAFKTSFLFKSSVVVNGMPKKADLQQLGNEPCDYASLAWEP